MSSTPRIWDLLRAMSVLLRKLSLGSRTRRRGMLARDLPAQHVRGVNSSNRLRQSGAAARCLDSVHVRRALSVNK